MSAVMDRALVVRRRGDGRFFCGFDKRHRVQTAWSLARAKFFRAERGSFGPFDASVLVNRLGVEKWQVVQVGPV